MKYRKKPVVIEAFCYCYDKEPKWFLDAIEQNIIKVVTNIRVMAPKHCVIKTLEGEMICTPFNFIIKGVAGEIYPCKADIFEKTYEAVND